MRKLFKAHEYLDKHIYKELKVRDDTQEGLWRCECGAMLWRTGDDKLERLGKAWRESNVIEWDKEWKDPVVLKALMIDARVRGLPCEGLRASYQNFMRNYYRAKAIKMRQRYDTFEE
jgi:hypothetical protein